MNPIRHPSNTRTLAAPAGWDHRGVPVEPLGITDTELNGVPCVMSFWQPDAEDLANIAAGSPIGLSIVGRTMPPAAVVTLMVEQHPDDAAVDRFSAVMKVKLAAARRKGRNGWDDPAQCSCAHLSQLLVDHVDKGDPVDVANFAMMLHQRGSMVLPSPNVITAKVIQRLDRTHAGHMVGHDQSDAPKGSYSDGFVKGFGECLALLKKLWGAE